jgi:hypothetical protein
MRPLGERSLMDALPGGAGRVPRHVRHPDGERRQVRRDLDQPRVILRQGQHEGELRHGHRAQQRLDIEAVTDLHDRLQAIGQSEGPHTVRRGQHGQAVRLRFPEGVVVHQIEQLFLDRPSLADIAVGQLAEGLAGEVLEGDAVRLGVLRERRCGQVQRHAVRSAVAEQRLEIGVRRDVHVQHVVRSPWGERTEVSSNAGDCHALSSWHERPAPRRRRRGRSPRAPSGAKVGQRNQASRRSWPVVRRASRSRCASAAAPRG